MSAVGTFIRYSIHFTFVLELFTTNSTSCSHHFSTIRRAIRTRNEFSTAPLTDLRFKGLQFRRGQFRTLRIAASSTILGSTNILIFFTTYYTMPYFLFTAIFLPGMTSLKFFPTYFAYSNQTKSPLTRFDIYLLTIFVYKHEKRPNPFGQGLVR